MDFPINRSNISPDSIENTFEDSCSSENSQEFDEYCSLEEVQEQLKKLAARRSKQRKLRKKFRREVYCKIGRKKRCRNIIKKACFTFEYISMHLKFKIGEQSC